MDIAFLGEFALIAKNRNLTLAAREIGSTQSTLSKRLAQAERELGTRLVNRGSGMTTLTLTPAGEEFLGAAIDIQQTYRSMRARVRRFGASGGRVVTVDSSVRPALLALHARLHERIAASSSPVELRWSAPGRSAGTMFDRLREGQVDLGVEPWSPMEDVGGLASVPVTVQKAELLVAGDDPLAARSSVGAGDLAGLRFLSAATQRAYAARKHLHAACRACGIDPHFEMLQYDSDPVMLLERLRPGCAAVVPQGCVAYYRAQVPDIVALPIEAGAFDFDLRAFFREDADEEVRVIARGYADAAATPDGMDETGAPSGDPPETGDDRALG